MKKYWIYILVLFFGSLQAQDLPKVSASADTLQIRIGEQIRLRVQADTDTLSFADFPELTQLGDMEVVRTSPVDTLQTKPFRKLLKEYYLTQWDSGTYKVAPLQVRINDSLFSTDSLMVKVQTVAVDTTKQDLYGFKAPVNIEGKPVDEIKQPVSPWWWLLLPVLAALAYYLYRRRQAVKKAQAQALTPYQWATQSLMDLNEQKLWLKNKVDEHYLRLTDTLKDYIEKELGMSAKEKISSELLQDLKKYRFEDGSYLSPELLERLEKMFQRADLAKFAKLQPNPADIDLDFSIIKDTIDQSHEVVQAIADAKAQKQAEIEAAKKRKKRVAWTVAGAIVLVLALLGGAVYYYLNKMDLTKNLTENVSAPEWVYSEYGSEPALALTTPHVLHPYDLAEVTDSLPVSLKLDKLFDEVSAYTDQNPVKKYVILALSMDSEKNTPKDLSVIRQFLSNILQLKGARNVNLQEADVENGKRFFGDFVIDVPVIGKNVKVNFDSRFFQAGKSVKAVLGFYLQGNKDNEALIDRVLQTAELVQ